MNFLIGCVITKNVIEIGQHLGSVIELLRRDKRTQMQSNKWHRKSVQKYLKVNNRTNYLTKLNNNFYVNIRNLLNLLCKL